MNFLIINFLFFVVGRNIHDMAMMWSSCLCAYCISYEHTLLFTFCRNTHAHTNIQYRSYVYAAFFCQDLVIGCNVTPHLNPEVPVAIAPLQCCTCLGLLTDTAHDSK